MSTRPAAIVTGAAGGIGKVISQFLAAEGFRVVVADLDVDGGEAAVSDLRSGGADALFLAADVSLQSHIQGLVAQTVSAFGALDVVISCAGITRVIDFFDLTPADWDTVLAVNARGCFLLLQEAARYMRDHGGGSIVNIASIAGKGYRDTSNIAYASSKGAVITMTRIAAAALGRYGVRVNSVCPGMTRTPMMENWLDGRAEASGLTTQELTSKLTSGLALGRLNRPEDVAAAVVFLASPAAAAITGQSINVDGGLIWD